MFEVQTAQGNKDHMPSAALLSNVLGLLLCTTGEWFASGKYMKYKQHKESRITCLLQLYFPRSNVQHPRIQSCTNQDHLPLG